MIVSAKIKRIKYFCQKSNMLYIRIKENSKQAKTFIEYVKSLPFVEIVDSPASESPYNKEFVKQINKSRKSKGKAIKLEDLWK